MQFCDIKKIILQNCILLGILIGNWHFLKMYLFKKTIEMGCIVKNTNSYENKNFKQIFNTWVIQIQLLLLKRILKIERFKFKKKNIF